tara:strand:+ start:3216 stop:3638 length:423 start_codon:yes stop_codon:yes gene_type:complete
MLISIALYFIAKIVLVAYLTLTICPMVGVGIRRLHDSGKNGMWILAANVPFLGFIYYYFMFLDSEPSTNIYGECPKESYMDKILKDELEPPAYTKPSSLSFDNLEFDLSILSPDKLFKNETAVQILIIVLGLISILMFSN